MTLYGSTPQGAAEHMNRLGERAWSSEAARAGRAGVALHCLQLGSVAGGG